MNRETMDTLAYFCVAQRNDFAADAWLRCAAMEREALGLAAAYLSMTSWYGHEDELAEIARMYHCLPESLGMYRETQAIDFDLTYFSTKVRSGIARCQPERDRRRVSRTESLLAARA